MTLPHKDYALPDVDLSHDEGDPRWHASGGQHGTPVRDADGKILRYTWNGLHPGHYAKYWQLCVAGPWEGAVRAFEADPDDAYAAWVYVDSHPVFWRFGRGIHEDYPVNHVSRLVHTGALRSGWPEVTPHRVCPETGRHEDDDALNTLTQWWYEFGPESLLPGKDGQRQPPWHDYKLDDGAPTYEEAVISIARAIHEHYGNDRMIVDSPEWLNE